MNEKDGVQWATRLQGCTRTTRRFVFPERKGESMGDEGWWGRGVREGGLGGRWVGWGGGRGASGGGDRSGDAGGKRMLWK